MKNKWADLGLSYAYFADYADYADYVDYTDYADYAEYAEYVDHRILDRRCIVKALINCFCKQDELTDMVVGDKVK